MVDPADAEPEVLIPAGLAILEAAEWVGAACWVELRLHELLTGWLASEADAGLTVTLWSVRAHRADVAAAWHRRLPELREFPREDFVRGDDAALDGLVDLVAAWADSVRTGALAEVLAGLAAHYRAHLDVAVGPADGPVADTLRFAVARTEADLALIGSPAPVSGQ